MESFIKGFSFGGRMQSVVRYDTLICNPNELILIYAGDASNKLRLEDRIAALNKGWRDTYHDSNLSNKRSLGVLRSRIQGVDELSEKLEGVELAVYRVDLRRLRRYHEKTPGPPASRAEEMVKDQLTALLEDMDVDAKNELPITMGPYFTEKEFRDHVVREQTLHQLSLEDRPGRRSYEIVRYAFGVAQMMFDYMGRYYFSHRSRMPFNEGYRAMLGAT